MLRFEDTGGWIVGRTEIERGQTSREDFNSSRPRRILRKLRSFFSVASGRCRYTDSWFESRRDLFPQNAHTCGLLLREHISNTIVLDLQKSVFRTDIRPMNPLISTADLAHSN